MDAQQISQRLGTITLKETGDTLSRVGWEHGHSPTQQVAYGVDSGGQIKIAFPLVTDWEAPQFDRPTQSGYTTAVTDGDAKLRVSWQPRGYVRPWRQCLVIDVYDGSLAHRMTP